MFLYSIIVAWLLGFTPSAAGTCNVTRVDAYQFNCARRAVIHKPAAIQTTTEATRIGCAATCLANIDCHSFRHVFESSQCTLYSKYQDQMSPTYYSDNRAEPGWLFDRTCYSTDCDTIAACTTLRTGRSAASRTHPGYKSIKYFFKEYACGYGVTANPYNFTSAQHLFNGTWSAHHAVTRCARGEETGSFDVHYHFPSASWVCLRYREESFGDNYYYENLAPERISRKRFTVKNDTVGPAYGYWYTNYNYE